MMLCSKMSKINRRETGGEQSDETKVEQTKVLESNTSEMTV